jgi:hypothetical protein
MPPSQCFIKTLWFFLSWQYGTVFFWQYGTVNFIWFPNCQNSDWHWKFQLVPLTLFQFTMCVEHYLKRSIFFPHVHLFLSINRNLKVDYCFLLWTTFCGPWSGSNNWGLWTYVLSLCFELKESGFCLFICWRFNYQRMNY